MKRTNKNNRKYKKNTNKRRRKSIKKMKGGDSVNIVAYKSLIENTDSSPGSSKDLFNYKVISRRDFPKTIVDTIVYKPWRDVEESLAEINHSIGLRKEDFGKYPTPKDTTEIIIDYPDSRITTPKVSK